MKDTSVILVVGPGAIGGALAARWALAGHNVLLLGRNAHSSRTLAARGITLTELNGRRYRARMHLGAACEKDPPCAAVIFCVKAGDLPSALRTAKPWIGSDTIVIGLQNGLGHEKILRHNFGSTQTVIGTCHFAADRTGPGDITLGGGNTIMLAKTPDNMAALAQTATLLEQGKWRVSVKDSESRMLWTKLIVNAAINPLGALCAVTNGRLADPPLSALFMQVLREATAIAKAAGQLPLYDDLEDRALQACRDMPNQRNSMLQDLQAGRRTEVRAILGPLLIAAHRTQTLAPTLEILVRLIVRLEGRK